MEPTTIATILTGAAGELLGGISTNVLSAATQKLVQKFKNRQSQLQKDFEQALPPAVARIEKQYGRQARILKFWDCLGQHAKRDETRALFTEYPFKLQNSPLLLAALFLKLI